MQGLIIKDLINLKSTLKIFIPIFIMWTIVFSINQNLGWLGLIIYVISIFVVISINDDKAVKWDGYALTMPISRKETVRVKYLLLVMLDSIGVLAFFIIGLVWANITNDLNWTEVFVSVFICAVGGIISGSTVIPLIYRFGTEKMSFLIYFLAMILTILMISVFGIVIKLAFLILNSNFSIWFFVCGVCGAFFYIALYLYGSYRISVRLYEKKEF